MSTLVTILHSIVSLFLILTILLQSGKGGGMGGAFGGSNSGTVFGGSGASTFLRKLTATAATIFMATSIVLAFLASHDSSDALEKFGRSQADLAKKKEEAKEKALLEGSGAGTGSAPSTMGLPGLDTPAPVDTGSADEMPAPATGSAAVPAPATGSAAAPAPAPATGSAAATPASGSPSGTVTTPPPAKATGGGTAAGNSTVVDPTRTGSAGIGLPNTPGTAPKTAPKAPAPKTESTTPSTTPAPAAKDTTGTNNATGSAAPAESSPNAPK